MVNTTTNCGWCGTLATMVPINGGYFGVGDAIATSNGPVKQGWALFRCPGCQEAMLAKGFISDASKSMIAVQSWYPTKPPTRPYPDSVPGAIKMAAQEAHSSLGVGNRQAAVLMARTTIEASAKAKGITKGDLVQKIDALFNQHLIYEHVRDAAHEIRHMGNEAAHGDLVDTAVTDDDVVQVLDLMDMVLDGVFIAPAKTAAARAARLAKKTVVAQSNPATNTPTPQGP